MGNRGGVGYPSDASDDEWSFVAPYLMYLVPGRREAAGVSVASHVQRGALAGAFWGTLADDAQRSASVAGGVPADAALDSGWMLRNHGRGFTFPAARVCGP